MRRKQQTMTARCFFFTMAMLALCSRGVAAEAEPAQLLDFTSGAKPDASAQTYSLHLGARGIPNGIEKSGKDGSQIYVCLITKDQKNGLLQVGDVILGVNDTLFTGNAVETLRAAVAAAPERNKEGNLRIIRWRKGVRETIDYFTVVPVPDLTVGTNRFTANTGFTYCLGPTGMRGWIYQSLGNDTKGSSMYYLDRVTSLSNWQVLVTSVGTGTPACAAGIQTNDVLMGVGVGGGAVSLFTTDTRVSLGNAISAAEATNGILRLLINRYGVATNQTYTLQLTMSNMRYSATAPYNCPKSALLLSHALKVISQGSITHGEALALLASGSTNYLPQVTAYARSIAPTNYVAPWPNYGGVEDSWSMGFRATFLSEYYMVTNDPLVVNGLVQRAVMLATADTMYGCYGHCGAAVYPYHKAAGVHGTGTGYGPVNACGLVCNLGVALGKRTGLQGIVTNAEVQPALDRARQFYNYVVNRGTVMYGEMPPGGGHIGAVGKNGQAGLLFAAIGGYPTQVQYFSRVSLAEWADLEMGHNGSGWGKLWRPLGVNLGGTNALATYFAANRWYFELTRRCNGSFSYDCIGDTPETCSGYWDSESYQGFLSPTAWNALFLAIPKRTLVITGRNADPTNTLDAAAISNAMWAAAYPVTMKRYTTNQLISHFSEYDGPVRQWAAEELAGRTGAATLVNGLMVLATNANPWVRETACNALGLIKVTNAIPTLAGRMYDTDPWVRHRANAALAACGASASTQLTNMMNAFTMFAVADPITGGVNWGGDPCGWGNGALADVLFNTLATSTMAQPTNILYPALCAGLRQPDGIAAANMIAVLDSSFTWTQVKDLAPQLMATALRVHQANNMWNGCQPQAINLLAKYLVEDAIPLSIMAPGSAVRLFTTPSMSVCVTNLKAYGSAAINTVPSLLAWSNYWTGADRDMATSTIYAIVHAVGQPALRNFKSFSSLAAAPGAITLPVSNILLSTFVTDLDGNAPKYTWKKVSGPGPVSFSQNASTASSNVTASFTAAGTYVLQASVSDSSINSSNYWMSTWNSYDTFQMWTNDYGSVTSNVTVQVYDNLSRAQ